MNACNQRLGAEDGLLGCEPRPEDESRGSSVGDSRDDRTDGVSPATAALNRKLGKNPGPRMLTRSEIDLLRQSAREIAAAVRDALNRGEGLLDPPVKTCDRAPRG